MSATPLWTPNSEQIARSNLSRFMKLAEERTGHSFSNYDELWRWSVDDLEGFWATLWSFADVVASAPYAPVPGTASEARCGAVSMARS